jgi:acetylglutamate/LysW-gamma-L-alpha-aminoadipate kinase
VCADVAALTAEGQPVVLVHGGSHLTNVMSEKLGIPPRFVTSVSGHTSRYTDQATLDVFTMVYAGQVNKRIVERLHKLGCNAVGLSGADGRLWTGPRKDAIKIIDEEGRRRMLRDDYTGRVEHVNADLLCALLTAGYTPVLCPPALSDQGELINVDGDRAAAATAVALGAATLVILSNVTGRLARRATHPRRPGGPGHGHRVEREGIACVATASTNWTYSPLAPLAATPWPSSWTRRG